MTWFYGLDVCPYVKGNLRRALASCRTQEHVQNAVRVKVDMICSDLHILHDAQLNFAARCISSLVSSSPARRFSLNRPIRRNRAIISSSPKWLLCSNSGSSAKATRATSTNIRAVIPKTRYRVVVWPACSCSCSCSASLSMACFWLRVRLRGLTTDLSRIGTKNWCTRRC